MKKVNVYDENKFFEDKIDEFGIISKENNIEIAYNRFALREDNELAFYDIFVSNDIRKLYEYMQSYEEKKEKIYIHIGKHITILKGNLRRFFEKFSPVDDIKEETKYQITEWQQEKIIFEVGDLIFGKNKTLDNILILFDLKTTKYKMLKY